MRIVIEAIPVRYGGFMVALERMLAAWSRDAGDEVHVAMAADVDLEVPAWMTTHPIEIGRPLQPRRILEQNRAVPRICREVGAEALLGITPATTIARVGCPKVIMVYDMRHELLPDQFSRGRRLLRKVSYDIGYHQADAIICISERAKRDLLRLHPRLARKPVEVVLWGAEHTDAWPRYERAPGEEPYALAFGHFVNKGVDRVVDAWRLLRERGDARPLVIVGLPRSARPTVEAKLAAAGLEDVIRPLPWLEDDEFQARFAGAGLIVFPSDHEGFGLPAVEAQRLGIPLVISTDEALLEVTGGRATIVSEKTAEALADAVAAGWGTTPEQLAAAREHVDSFTWTRMASETRSVLERAAAGRRG